MKRKSDNLVDVKKTDEQTHIDLHVGGMKLSIVGLATAVIAILAVLGLVYVSVKLIDLAGRAVDRVGTPTPARVEPFTRN